MQFINKETKIKFNAESEKGMMQSELVSLPILQRPMKEGATVKEMRMIMKLTEKLESAKVEDEVAFTEDEAQYVKESLESFKWALIHQDIIDLYAELNIE